jgi:hypothetical protein
MIAVEVDVGVEVGVGVGAIISQFTQFVQTPVLQTVPPVIVSAIEYCVPADSVVFVTLVAIVVFAGEPFVCTPTIVKLFASVPLYTGSNVNVTRFAINFYLYYKY